MAKGLNSKPPGEPEQQLKEQEVLRQARVNELKKQQEGILQELANLKDTRTPKPGRGEDTAQGQLLLEQIRATLAPKEVDKDPNKALLKALITSQNKSTGSSGTSTLRPDIFNRLTGDNEFSMAEWLASLNKQEEGESEIGKMLSKQCCILGQQTLVEYTQCRM